MAFGAGRAASDDVWGSKGRIFSRVESMRVSLRGQLRQPSRLDLAESKSERKAR